MFEKYSALANEVGNIDQVEDDWLIWAKHFSSSDSEQSGIADVASCSSHSNSDWFSLFQSNIKGLATSTQMELMCTKLSLEKLFRTVLENILNPKFQIYYKACVNILQRTLD